ncbi:MAG: hypothetical protein JW869_05090 [Candidatus Omnitrophica bacterium]|nr:hypothetical protein [Candidatus Omnitrophota bacterium]
MNRFNSFLLILLSLVFVYCPKSRAITVVAGDIDHFTLIVSQTVVAGEPFSVTFIAEDKFGNPINNYSEIGSEVEIQVIGQGKISPTQILPAEFKQGKAIKVFVYDRAETFTIVASAKAKPHLSSQVLAGVTINARTSSSDTKDLPVDEEKMDEYSKSDLEEKLIRLSAALEAKEKENLSLKGRLSKNTLQRASFKGQLDKNKTLLTQAQARLGEKEAQLSEFTQAHSELSRDKESLEKEIKKLKENAAFLEQRIRELSYSLSDKETESVELKGNLTKAYIEIDELKNRVIDAESFLAHTQAKLGQLRGGPSLAETELQEEEKARTLPVQIEGSSPLDRYSVKVFKVSGRYVVLPLGKKDGLETGMLFTVYKDEKPIAEIEVAELYEDMFMANIKNASESETIKEGDMVRLR